MRLLQEREGGLGQVLPVSHLRPGPDLIAFRQPLPQTHGGRDGRQPRTAGGDGSGFARAVEAMRNLHGWAPTPRVAALWTEAIERLGDADEETTALLASRMGLSPVSDLVGRPVVDAMLEGAREIANRLGNPVLLGAVANIDGVRLAAAGQFEAAVERFTAAAG